MTRTSFYTKNKKLSLGKKLSPWNGNLLSAMGLEELSANESYLFGGESMGAFLNDHWKTFLNNHPYVYTGLVAVFTGVTFYLGNCFSKKPQSFGREAAGEERKSFLIEEQNLKKNQLPSSMLTVERKDQATCACSKVPITELINKVNSLDENLKNCFKLENLHELNANLQTELALSRGQLAYENLAHNETLQPIITHYELEKQASGELKQAINGCKNVEQELSSRIEVLEKKIFSLRLKHNIVAKLANDSITTMRPIQGPETDSSPALLPLMDDYHTSPQDPYWQKIYTGYKVEPTVNLEELKLKFEKDPDGLLQYLHYDELLDNEKLLQHEVERYNQAAAARDKAIVDEIHTYEVKLKHVIQKITALEGEKKKKKVDASTTTELNNNL